MIGKRPKYHLSSEVGGMMLALWLLETVFELTRPRWPGVIQISRRVKEMAFATETLEKSIKEVIFYIIYHVAER